MTIDEAINISWGADQYRGVPRPTVEEALEAHRPPVGNVRIQLAHRPRGTGCSSSGGRNARVQHGRKRRLAGHPTAG